MLPKASWLDKLGLLIDAVLQNNRENLGSNDYFAADTHE